MFNQSNCKKEVAHEQKPKINVIGGVVMTGEGLVCASNELVSLYRLRSLGTYFFKSIHTTDINLNHY